MTTAELYALTIARTSVEMWAHVLKTGKAPIAHRRGSPERLETIRRLEEAYRTLSRLLGESNA